MKDTIRFDWIENGIKNSRDLKREEINSVFKGLLEGFRDDNTISTIFVEKIIPNAESVFINKDSNATQDIPIIGYVVDDQMVLVKILRYHKIVWSILDKYCTA